MLSWALKRAFGAFASSIIELGLTDGAPIPRPSKASDRRDGVRRAASAPVDPIEPSRQMRRAADRAAVKKLHHRYGKKGGR